MTINTGVFLGVSHAELMGDAKDSPIVFDSGQTQISSGIFFRF
ncbi:MipA/OmpV family protein [Phaeobacter inhibens]|nr:MipA/OmpV family protein [Phaeobacter inhibens]